MAAAKRTLTELEGQPKESWRILDHAIVLYPLFPNTVLTYTQDHCGMFTSFPVSPDESVMQFSVLVSPEEKAKKPESYWKANVDLFATALVEDFGIGETIQRNFRSGANSQQTFGKFEKALGWYHAEIDKASLGPAREADSVSEAAVSRPLRLSIAPARNHRSL